MQQNDASTNRQAGTFTCSAIATRLRQLGSWPNEVLSEIISPL